MLGLLGTKVLTYMNYMAQRRNCYRPSFYGCCEVSQDVLCGTFSLEC